MEASSTRSKMNVSPNEDEFEQLWSSKSDHTEKATKKAVTIFREYLNENDFPTEFENLDKQTIGTILSRFYLEIRKLNGDYYKVASMNAIRTGINRHLKNEYPEFVDIIRDSEFKTANVCFKAAIRQARNAGKGEVQHHSIIADEDLEKLYTSGIFDQDSPSGLQLKVWFELMLYIGGWGRENLREMKAEHFVVRTDSQNGRQFVALAMDEIPKRNSEETPSSRASGDRIYATNTDQCPVMSFKKYLSKLNPDCEAFFQTPIATAPESIHKPWYKGSPLGKHTLGTFMSVLSRQADLSQMYTNHCIQKTRVMILDWEGVAPNKSIPTGTGHVSEDSSMSSTELVSDTMKERISDILSRAVETRGVPTENSSYLAPTTVQAGAEGGFHLERECKDVKPNISHVEFHLTQSEQLGLDITTANLDRGHGESSSEQLEMNVEVANMENAHDESDSPSLSTGTGQAASPGSINSRSIPRFHTRSTATPTPESSGLDVSPGPRISTSTSSAANPTSGQGVVVGSVNTSVTSTAIHVPSGHSAYLDSVITSHTPSINASSSRTVQEQQQQQQVHQEQQRPFELRNCNVTINYHTTSANTCTKDDAFRTRTCRPECQVRSSRSPPPRVLVSTDSNTVVTTSSSGSADTTGTACTIPIQQLQCPFLLHDCNVTINYYK